jgi:hypothetical protein
MTNLNRIRVQWTGFNGAPGVSTFYSLDTATVMESLHTLFDSLSSRLPNTVTCVIEPSGDVIDDTTGDIVGAWAGTPQAAVTGTQTQGYQAASGAQLSWGTSTILDGHRLRGRTFLVPLAGNMFSGTGQLQEINRAAMETSALAYLVSQDASFVIWHRPFAGRAADPTRGIKAKAAHPGGHGLVTTAKCPAGGVVLRSRRD